MANSDKNILITPSVGLSTNPTIKFNGANNTPTTLRVLDDGTVSFEGTAGQLFSISDGLTGSIFSVNDISGIPSIEALDTGLVKINQYNGNTVFGSSSPIQNSSLVNSKVSIYTVSASTPGLIIKSAASQTANLQEWQNSSGVSIAQISATGTISTKPVAFSGNLNTPIISVTDRSSTWAAGNFAFRSDSGGTPRFSFTAPNAASEALSINGNSVGVQTPSPTAVFQVTSNGASNVVSIIKGAASQTANLTQWQDSAGSLAAWIGFDGRMYLPYLMIGTWNLDAMQTIYSNSASRSGSIIRGATSQTADLQQWQDSTGTVLTKITSGGTLRVPIITDAAATGSLIYMNTTNINIDTRTATNIGLIINGVASQTANLQEWRNSSGSTRLAVSSYGTLNSYTEAIFNNTLNGTGTSLLVKTNNADGKPLVVQGAASQTANLQEWQNSAGTAVASMDVSGKLIVPTLRGPSGSVITLGVDGNPYSLSISATQFDSYGPVPWRPYNASMVGFIVRGLASQTEDLQEWQNSSGTVLTKVDSSGNITAPDYRLSNSLYTIRKNIKKTVDPAGSALANNTYDLFQIAFPSSLQGVFAIQVSIRNSGYGQSMSYTLPVTYRMDWLSQYGITNPFVDGANFPWVDLTPITFAPRHLMTSDFLKLQARIDNNTIYFRIKLTGTLTNSPLFDVYMQHSEEFANTTITELFSTGTDSTTSSVMPNFLSSKAGLSAIFNPLTISASAAANTPLIIKGFTSQSANLTEWQNNSGVQVAYITSAGSIRAPFLADTAGTGAFIQMNSGGAALVNTRTASIVGLVVRGQNSQTADLQQWQDVSGAVLLRIYSSGAISRPSGGILILNESAGDTVVRVRGFASQTADLQQWQKSDGTVLAEITASGSLELNGKDIELMNIMGAF